MTAVWRPENGRPRGAGRRWTEERLDHARELFGAQGFPPGYIVDHGVAPDGGTIRLTNTASIRMCGNSVCPPLAAALVEANCGDMAIAREAAE